MSVFLTIAIAVFFDRLLGEPLIYHPLRGFTRFAAFMEDGLHRQANVGFKHTEVPEPGANQVPEANQAMDAVEKVKGLLAIVFLVLPAVSIVALLSKHLIAPLNFVFDVLVLYLALGAHNLKQHALDIKGALISDNLELARKEVGLLVHCDTKEMSRQDVIFACVGSVLEHGNDAIMAPIFWFMILGAPGAVLYRLVSLLHSMWGYKDARYKNFGLVATRINHVLNWIPSRLTAFTYILLGDIKLGWQCFSEHSKTWNSPNTELVTATGAGALNLEISGDVYNNDLKKGSKLGVGKPPDLSDIARTCDLIDRSMILWLAFILALSLSHC